MQYLSDLLLVVAALAIVAVFAFKGFGFGGGNGDGEGSGIADNSNTVSVVEELEYINVTVSGNEYIYDNKKVTLDELIDSIKSLDKNGNVLYAGTFSKTLAPGLMKAHLLRHTKLLKPNCRKTASALSKHSKEVQYEKVYYCDTPACRMRRFGIFRLSRNQQADKRRTNGNVFRSKYGI